MSDNSVKLDIEQTKKRSGGEGAINSRRKMTPEEAKEIYRDPRWRNIRRQVKRESEWRCERCGKEAASLEVHHKVPLLQGGAPFERENLEVLCLACHRRVHRRMRARRRLKRLMITGPIVLLLVLLLLANLPDLIHSFLGQLFGKVLSPK